MRHRRVLAAVGKGCSAWFGMATFCDPLQARLGVSVTQNKFKNSPFPTRPMRYIQCLEVRKMMYF